MSASSFFTFLVFGIDARCAGCERRFSLFLLDFSIAMYTPYLPWSTRLRGGVFVPRGSSVAFFSSVFPSFMPDLYLWIYLCMHFDFLCLHKVGNAFSLMTGDF